MVVVFSAARAAKEKDRTCPFREDQAPRGAQLAQRLVREPLPPAATRETEREGANATIACGGGGWKVRGMSALVQDVGALRSMIDVEWGMS